MTHKLLSILVLAITLPLVVQAGGGRQAVDFFTQAPDTIMQVLSRNTRLDMIDYFNSPVNRPSDNAFGGKSKVTSLDSTQVSVELSKNATAQIALLTQGADTVVAYILTLATPVPDSEVRYYDTSWRRVTPKWAVNTENPDTWVKPELKGKERREVLANVPFVLASAKFEPETGSIVFTNNLSEYYANDLPEWFGNLIDTITIP